MTIFHPMLRRLIHRNIPQLNNHDVDRYDSLIALRHQLIQEKHISHSFKVLTATQQQFSKEIDNGISDTTKQAQAVFSSCAREYDASIRLWVARRQLLFHQGNFFQIPTNLQGIKRLVAAIGNYRKVQIQTFPVLAANRIRYFFKNLSISQVLGIATLLMLLILVFSALESK